MFRRLAFSSAEPRPVQGHRRALPAHGSAGGVDRALGRVAPVDDLTLRQRQGIVAAMLLLHLGAAAWLWLLPARAPLAVVPPATLRVDWIAAPSPVVEPPPPAAPTPLPPKPVPPRPVAPQPKPLIAAPEAVVPAAMVTAPPPAVDSAPAPVETAPTPAPPTLTAPAAPKTLPPEAVQYLVPPAPVYPKLSSRYGESGRVLVRVYIDEGGVPRSVQVTESSGHPRLDDAARTAVQATRFKPYAENGRPTAGWAFIPLTFDLEK